MDQKKESKKSTIADRGKAGLKGCIQIEKSSWEKHKKGRGRSGGKDSKQSHRRDWGGKKKNTIKGDHSTMQFQGVGGWRSHNRRERKTPFKVRKKNWGKRSGGTWIAGSALEGLVQNDSLKSQRWGKKGGWEDPKKKGDAKKTASISRTPKAPHGGDALLGR